MKHFKSITLRILALLLCLSAVVPLSAQVMHAIIFADTKDPSVGACDLQDYYRVSVEMSTIASATGMQLKSYYYKDDRCSSRNLKDLLASLQTQPEDVIFFYYTGHGTRSANDVSQFPQMCLGSTNQMNFFPLERVLNELSYQPARLKLVLGDCCNNVVGGVLPKDPSAKGPTVLRKSAANVYGSLFIGNMGTVIASGCQAGETSAALSCDNQPAGGAFTISMMATLKDYATKGLESTWETLLTATQQTTYQLAEHTPMFNISVKEATEADLAAQQPSETAVAEETQTAPTAPVQQREPQNTATDDDYVEPIVLLTAIGNEKLGVETRVKVQDKALKALFASPNAKIEVVGSNGTTIVATERAEDFVLRLCTTHNLLNLVELEKQTDDKGRYTYLKVHEIYMK
ncbi:MAG: caspase family protein [Prevotella sp.]|nr:caspase family protein [Prevotella sp.]